jgi:hypothetical protein
VNTPHRYPTASGRVLVFGVNRPAFGRFWINFSTSPKHTRRFTRLKKKANHHPAKLLVLNTRFPVLISEYLHCRIFVLLSVENAQHRRNRSIFNLTLLRRLFVCALILSLPQLFGCGSTQTTVKGPPYLPLMNALDKQFFHSPVGDIVGHYPKDWLLVNIEQMAEFDEVLFLYSDPERTRGLVLVEIPGTAELRRNVERDGLLALAQESFQLKNKRLDEHHQTETKLAITKQPELFTVEGKLFASYEYAGSETRTGTIHQNRSVVFTTGARFYELAMIELKPTLKMNHIENFRLLESVIGGLEGVAVIRTTTVKDNTP